MCAPIARVDEWRLPTVSPMRIYYSASSYGSHLRAAKAYRELIGQTYSLVSDIDSADVVILHHEPRDFSTLYADYPALKRKYVIGYFVWEADDLPDSYKASISHVQEIWTCSSYSKAAFDKYHPNVHYVPHVVERDARFSPAVLEQVKRRLRYDTTHTYFLAVALQASSRKNVGAIVRAFTAIQPHLPDAKLILRTGSVETAALGSGAGIIALPDIMRWQEINALYYLSSVYVSAHHAEGWGLTLSDAMVCAKPVIATGYSGNLEYMNQKNSFLVDYTVENIRPEDCEDLFHSGMQWAYPDEEDLQRQMLFVHAHQHDDSVTERVRLASTELRKFDRASIAALLGHRLNEVRGALQTSVQRLI